MAKSVFFVAAVGIFLLATLSTLCESSVAADKKAASQSNKVAELLQLSRSSSSNTVKFDTNSYRNFVVKQPRPYQLIVLYTANPRMCLECQSLEEAFKRVALSYSIAGANQPSEGRLPVFFGVVDISVHRGVADLHGLTTVPHVVSTEPKSFKKSGAGQQIALRPKDVFSYTKKDVTAGDLMSFVNGKSKRSVEVFTSASERISGVMFLIAMLGCLGIGFYGVVLLVLKFPILIPIGGLLIQFVATSGIFFNLQHGMSLFGYDPNTRKMITFSQNNRMQFLGEGLLMSGCSVLCGLLLLGVAMVPTMEGVRKRKSATALCGVCALFFFFFLHVSFSTYAWKTGWYQPTFFPAGDAIRGPLRHDRGNSF